MSIVLISTASLTIPAKTSSLYAVTEFVRKGAREASLPEVRLGELDLLVEEVFVNVCRHAYPDVTQGIVTFTYSVPALGVSERGSR